METADIILLVSASAIAGAALSALWTKERMRKKVTYILDALEDKELNFRFDEKPLFSRSLNRTLNRIRGIFDKERCEIMEQERYYGQMLDHVQTGIAVIETSQTCMPAGKEAASSKRSAPGRAASKTEGRVRYCNSTALSLLGISSLGNIRQLRNVSDSLYEAFLKATEKNEERASWYNESGQRTISITASVAHIGGRQVRVVAFNDISNEIAENEQAAWSRLIRVLTHEIMNTVTPIAALSGTLAEYAPITCGEGPDIKEGLATISRSSENLIKFVQSYRDLTKVAPPSKKAFYVRDMVGRIINLTWHQTEQAGAAIGYSEKDEDILLYADESQISQIIINMIRNAVQAGATSIQISAGIGSAENVIISVANNGAPISKESREQIFVPFFTTKPEGTGIGLSLSRQIMRQHNGTVLLTRSDSTETVFTLNFR